MKFTIRLILGSVVFMAAVFGAAMLDGINRVEAAQFERTALQ